MSIILSMVGVLLKLFLNNTTFYKNQNTSRMKYSLITVLTLSLFACNSNFKYKVTNPDRPAIFYTDTLEFVGDSMGYHNTDGSYVLISDTCGYDCKIDTLK